MKPTQKRVVAAATAAAYQDKNSFSKAVSLLVAQKQRKSNLNGNSSATMTSINGLHDNTAISEGNSYPTNQIRNSTSTFHPSQQLSYISQQPSQTSSNTKPSLAQQRLSYLLESAAGGFEDQRSSQIGSSSIGQNAGSIFPSGQQSFTDASPSRKTRQPLETRTRINTHLLTEGCAPSGSSNTFSILDTSQQHHNQSKQQSKVKASRGFKATSKASSFADCGAKDKTVSGITTTTLGNLNQSITFESTRVGVSNGSGGKNKNAQGSQRTTASPGQRHKPAFNANYLGYSNYHPLNSLLPTQERHSSSGSAAQVFIQQVKDKIQQSRHKSKQPSFSLTSQNTSQIYYQQQDPTWQNDQQQFVVSHQAPGSVKSVSTNNNLFQRAYEKNSQSVLVGKSSLDGKYTSVSPKGSSQKNNQNLLRNFNNFDNIQYNNNYLGIETKAPSNQSPLINSYKGDNLLHNNGPQYHGQLHSISPNIQSIISKKPKIILDFIHPASVQTRAQTQASSRRDQSESQKSTSGQAQRSLGQSHKSPSPMFLHLDDSTTTASNRQSGLQNTHHSKSSPKLLTAKGIDSVRRAEEALEEFQAKNQFTLETAEFYFDNFFQVLSELQNKLQLSGKQQLVSASHNTASTLFNSSSFQGSSFPQTGRFFESLREILIGPVNSLLNERRARKLQSQREQEVLEMKLDMFQQERNQLLHLTGALSKQQKSLQAKGQAQQQNNHPLLLKQTTNSLGAQQPLGVNLQKLSHLQQDGCFGTEKTQFSLDQSLNLSKTTGKVCQSDIEALQKENSRLREMASRQRKMIKTKKAKEELLLGILQSHNISDSLIRTPDSLNSPVIGERNGYEYLEITQAEQNQSLQNREPKFSLQEEVFDDKEDDNYWNGNDNNTNQKKQKKPFLLSSQNETDPEEEGGVFKQEILDGEEGEDVEDDQDEEGQEQQILSSNQNDYRNQFYLKQDQSFLSKNQYHPAQSLKQPPIDQKLILSKPSVPPLGAFKKLEAEKEKKKMSILNNYMKQDSPKMHVKTISEGEGDSFPASERSMTDSESDVLSIPINDNAYASQATKILENGEMKDKLKINLGCLHLRETPKLPGGGGAPANNQGDIVGYHDEFMNRFNEFSQSWRDAINAEKRYDDPSFPSQAY